MWFTGLKKFKLCCHI